MLGANFYTPAWAAPAAGVEDVRFRTLDLADGLSQPTGRAIAQDTEGFIWVGTQDGLNRFDGRRFVNLRHDPSNPNSLSANHIVDLAADDSGGLWIATQTGGLNYRDPATGRFVRYRHSPDSAEGLASDALLAIALDDAGRVWIETDGGQLQCLDPVGARFLPALTPPDDGQGSFSLLGSIDDSLLLGRGGRLHAWRPGATTIELLADPGPEVERLRAVLATDDRLWVGSDDAGLFEYVRGGRLLKRWHTASEPSALLHNQIRSLLADQRGRVWVGTQSGLARIDPVQRSVRNWGHDPNDPLGLPGSRVVSLLEDREGMIWAGTWTGGLAVFDPQTSAFTLVRNRPDDASSLPGNAAAAVLENPDGSVWVSLLDVGGLARFDLERGLLERYTADPGTPGQLPHRMIGSLLADGPDLLVGTLGAGLVRFDRDTSRFERVVEAPERDVARTAMVENLQRDRNGTLWVSTIGHGLYRRCADCAGFEQFVPNPGDPHAIPGDEVNGVLETSDETLWVALRRYGLSRLDRDSGRFTTFAAPAGGLRSSSISGLYESRAGEVWVGTQGGGVHRMDGNGTPPEFIAIGRPEGLDADAIGEIAEDRDGRIWVSTTAGLSRIDPATLRVENFPFVDGHTGAGFFIGSVDRPSADRVWFGGVRGLVRVDLDAVERQIPEPPTVLTNLLLFNQPVQPGDHPRLARRLAALDELVLGHDESLVTLEFTAPGTLRHAHSLRYSYRLLGFDRDWVDTPASRALATYTGLPDGAYRFQVRAGVSPKSWGPVTDLALRVRPAPWLGPGALAAYAIIALGLLALIGWRVRTGLERRRRAQEQIAASRERLRMALWGSRDELWEADMHQNTLVRENRIDRVSRNDDVARMSLDEFWASVHPDDVADLKRAFADHLRGGTERFEAQFRVRSRHGTWHWMLSRGRVQARDADGRAWLMSGTTRDITGVKRTEEALRHLNEELESRVSERTAELEASNSTLSEALQELKLAQRQLVQTEKMAALGGLVAGIAHEINTPLGIGVTAASHLESEACRARQSLDADAAPAPQTLRGFVAVAAQSSQLILRNLRRADQLVRSFKQVAVDQASEQRRTFEVCAYLDEILLSLHPELKRSPHAVEQTVDGSFVMDSYPGALYQVMVNLIMNSLTHAFADGQAGTLRIDVRGDDEQVVIRYRDDGRGMDKAVADKMFDPFFTTRRGQGGSGLGLHIVYNLVTQIMGGRIEADTAPGQGLAVTLRLPRTAP